MKKQSTNPIKKKSLYFQKVFVLIAASSVAVGIMLLGYFSMQRIIKSEAAWDSFHEKALGIENNLREIQSYLGYGGLIHSYKDYLVYRTENSYQSFQEKHEALLKIINSYNIYSLYVEERLALIKIESSIYDYKTAIDIIHDTGTFNFISVGETSHPNQNILSALDTLKSFNARRTQQQKSIVKESFDDILNTFMLGLWMIPIIYISGLFLISLLNKLFKTEASLDTAIGFIEAAPDAMLCVNKHGKIVQVNNQAEKLFGFSRGELLNFNVSDLLPERYKTPHQQHLKDYFESPESRFMALGREVTANTKHSNEVPVEISLSFFEKEHQSLGIVTIRDVTRRKIAEDNLRHSEERLRLSQKIGHIGSWEWDINADKLICSDEFFCILGLLDNEEKQLPYTDFLSRIPDQEREHVVWTMKTAIKNFQSFQIEHYLNCFDGVNRIVLIQGEGQYNKNRQAVRALGILQDITKRRQAEADLRTSEERFRMAFEAAAHGMALVSANGRFLRINHSLCQLSGYSQQELLTRSLSSITYPDDWKNISRNMDDLLATTERDSIHLETRHFHQEGHIVWALLSISLVRASNGKPIHFVLQLQDISERKIFEAELQKSKEEAERANRSKSHFLTNMSHELRTPLNGILGYAQLLLREETDPSRHSKFDMILRSGEHLLTLIEDILDLSKIEAGHFDLIETDFNISLFLNSLVDLFQMRAHDKGLAFIYECMTPLPSLVKGDEKRLRQILINLLGNALKFTQTGKITLHARYTQHCLEIDVEDTGIGMDPDMLEHLFEPFRQFGDNNQRSQGTGLGLSITKRLVGLMDGSIRVESKPQAGTRFCLRLPLPTSTNVSSLMPELKQDMTVGLVCGYQSMGQTRAYKILIVDDKTTSRRLLSDLLGPLGFLLREAKNGMQAVVQAKEWQPDLILMDVVMPEMDGLEASRRILQTSTRPIPIIAVSAKAFETERFQSLEAGCQEHLTKPVDTEKLLQILERYLPLSWCYNETEQACDKLSPMKGGLSEAEYIELVDLLKRGRVQDLLVCLQNLAEQNPELETWCHEAMGLVKHFDLKSFKSLLEAGQGG